MYWRIRFIPRFGLGGVGVFGRRVHLDRVEPVLPPIAGVVSEDGVSDAWEPLVAFLLLVVRHLFLIASLLLLVRHLLLLVRHLFLVASLFLWPPADAKSILCNRMCAFPPQMLRGYAGFGNEARHGRGDSSTRSDLLSAWNLSSLKSPPNVGLSSKKSGERLSIRN